MLNSCLQQVLFSLLFSTCCSLNYKPAKDMLQIKKHVQSNDSPFDLVQIRNAIKTSRNSIKNNENYQKISSNEEKNFLEETLAKKQVPSLMSEMYLQMQHFESTSSAQCGQPGTPGHVVRSLQNKGGILYQDDNTVVTELRFSLRGVFLEHEKIKSSMIYIPPPSDINQNKWISNRAGTVYQYKIYVIPNKKWGHFVHRLKQNSASALINKNRSSKLHEKNISDLVDHFGSLISKRNVTINHGQTSDIQTDSLQVQTLVLKWHKEFSKRQVQADVTSRAVLIITETTSSSFERQMMTANKEKCVVSETPKLVIVSVDQTQCPDSGDEHNELVREKRDLSSKNKNIKDSKAKKSTDNSYLPKQRVRKSTICQRYPLWIDFKDVGWSDWVIAPARFQVYRCAGDCPFPLGGALNGTNHAMLMTMMNSVDPGKSPMPCCVPTRLKPVSLLYLDNSDNVVLRQYEDMVIEACGCR